MSILSKRLNQKAESWFSTAPFFGIGSGRITSKAESRSVATKRSVSPRSKTSRTFPLRSFLIPGRSTKDCGETAISATSLRHGWNRRQTACADFTWTRLGVFQRSAESFWKSDGWRCHLPQGRQRSFDWQRDLQFKVADRRATFLAAQTRPRPG